MAKESTEKNNLNKVVSKVREILGSLFNWIKLNIASVASLITAVVSIFALIAAIKIGSKQNKLISQEAAIEQSQNAIASSTYISEFYPEIALYLNNNQFTVQNVGSTAFVLKDYTFKQNKPIIIDGNEFDDNSVSNTITVQTPILALQSYPLNISEPIETDSSSTINFDYEVKIDVQNYLGNNYQATFDFSYIKSKDIITNFSTNLISVLPSNQ